MPLERAIAAAVGVKALAQKLGIRPQAVSQWKRQQRLPASRVLAVERHANGEVSREELRPDLYPPNERRRPMPEAPRLRRHRKPRPGPSK